MGVPLLLKMSLNSFKKICPFLESKESPKRLFFLSKIFSPGFLLEYTKEILKMIESVILEFQLFFNGIEISGKINAFLR